MNNNIIQIEHVSKRYRLGIIGSGTFRGDFQAWCAKLFSKDNPNQLIGSDPNGRNESFLALDDINFSVKHGERVGIIGHNGAGKSTLLKLLARVTAPTQGTIYLNGRVASMLEVGTGFHVELTGRQNIYMNGSILGMKKPEIDKKIDHIIEFSECAQFIDTPVKRYSSGMYVKLAFSVAAHLDSEILIMDEVLAVGDMNFQKKCLQKMNNVSQTEGRTILYVSHNMNTIRQLCERCIVLDHGKVVYDGNVDEAIGYYLGNNIHDLPAHYDLRSAKRPSDEHGSKFKLTHLEFVSHQNAIFERTEPLKFKIDFETSIDAENLKLYYVIRSTEGNTIGLAQTYEDFGCIRAGEKRSATFEMDISNLAAGKYYFVLDIFSDLGEGRLYSLDHPMTEVLFEIVDNHPMGLLWQTKFFGHVALNAVKHLR